MSTLEDKQKLLDEAAAQKAASLGLMTTADSGITPQLYDKASDSFIDVPTTPPPTEVNSETLLDDILAGKVTAESLEEQQSTLPEGGDDQFLDDIINGKVTAQSLGGIEGGEVGSFETFRDTAASSTTAQVAKTARALVDGVHKVAVSLGADKRNIQHLNGDDITIGGYSLNELSDSKVTDKITGLNPQIRVNQQAIHEKALAIQKEADKAYEEGNYIDAAKNIALEMWVYTDDIAGMLGDTTGELAFLAAGTPGFIAAVGARVDTSAVKFEKLNNRPMTYTELTQSTALNSISLAVSKFNIVKGINTIKPATIAKSGLSKSVLDGMAVIATEYGQERFDSAIEEFTKLPEDKRTLEAFKAIADTPENRMAGVAAAVLAGTLESSVGSVTAVGASAEKANHERKIKKLATKIKEARTVKAKQTENGETTNVDITNEPVADTETTSNIDEPKTKTEPEAVPENKTKTSQPTEEEIKKYHKVTERAAQKIKEELKSQKVPDAQIETVVNDYIESRNKEIPKVQLNIKPEDKAESISLVPDFNPLAESARLTNQGGKKSKTYDVSFFDNEIIKNLLEHPDNVHQLDNDLVDDIKLEAKRRKIFDDVVSGKEEELLKPFNDAYTATTENPKAAKALGKITTDNTKESIARLLTVLTDVLEGGITAERDIYDNLGFQSRNVNGVRKSQVTANLGRRYLNSIGLKLAGTSEGITKKYAEIGQNILDYGEAIGVVEKSTEVVPSPYTYDEKGRSDKLKDLLDKGVPAQELRNDKGHRHIGVKDDIVKSTIDYNPLLRLFSKLSQPSNREELLIEPTTEVVSDTLLPDEQKSTIQTLQTLSYELKPDALEFLQNLAASTTDSIEELLKGEDTFFSRSDSKVGQEISKKHNLERLIEAVEQGIPKKFYYQYESAINQRIHVMQNILEYQGDKYMSRHFVTGGEYSPNSLEEVDFTLRYISDELGLSEAAVKQGVITGTLEVGKDVTIPLASIAAGDTKISDPGSLKILQDSLGLASPFEAMSLIRGLADIHSGVREGKLTADYTTSFEPEQDMSASGVINTLMNLSGYPRVQAVLRDILEGGKDPYSIIVDTLNKSKSLASQKAKEESLKLKELGVTERQLTKYTVMTWFYGSPNKNVIERMGDSLKVDLANKALHPNTPNALKQKIRKYFAEVLGVEAISESKLRALSVKEQEIIEKHFRDKLGKPYVQAIEDTFPDVKTYRENMNTIHNMLIGSGKWDNTITTPLSKANGHGNKFRARITKQKQQYYTIGEGEFALSSTDLPNRNSFSVNLQHLTDAAILLLSDSGVHTPNGRGAMSIHDAKFGTPEFLKKYKEHYEGNTVRIANEYDFLSIALDELENVIKQLDDSGAKTLMTEQYNDLRKEANQRKRLKKQYLEGVTPNFFGDKKRSVNKDTINEIANSKETMVNYDYNDTTTPFRLKLAGLLHKLKNSTTANEDIVEFIEKSNIPDSDVKTKILEAFKNKDVTAVIGEDWGGLEQDIYVDTNAKSEVNKDMTPEKFISVLGHELDHSLQYKYISENMNAPEVAYLRKVVGRISKAGIKGKGFSKKVRSRLEYIIDPLPYETNATKVEARQIAELVAIFRNEPDVLEEVVSKGILKDSIFRSGIKDFFKKVREYFKRMLNTKGANYFDSTFKEAAENSLTDTVRAMEVLDYKARLELQLNDIQKEKEEKGEATEIPAFIKPKNQENEFTPYEVASRIIQRENAYVSSIIELLGGYTYDVFQPVIRTGHVNLKRKSELYRNTVNLIRTNFIDTDFAQRMKATLGVSKDINDKDINELLQLGDDIAQKSNEMLTSNLPNLEHRINTMFPDEADQRVVHAIFSYTGIGGLGGIAGLLEKAKDGTLDIKKELATYLKSESTDTKEVIDNLAYYYTTGKMKAYYRNTLQAELFGDKYEALVALAALDKIPRSQALLAQMTPDMRKELLGLAVSNYALNKEVNLQEKSFYRSSDDKQLNYSTEFDGRFSKDSYNGDWEYSLISRKDLKSNKFTEDKQWKILRRPTASSFGLAVRESYKPKYVDGVGVTSNQFSNGILLHKDEADRVRSVLKRFKNDAQKEAFLVKNQMYIDTNTHNVYINVSHAEKIGHLKQEASASSSLWRTYVAQSSLLQMQGVRDIITDRLIEKVDTPESLDRLGLNLLKDSSSEKHPMFIRLSYDYGDYQHLPKGIKKYYKPAEGLSNYNNFKNEITLVKRSLSDIIIGTKNFSLFGNSEYRTLAKWEQKFKHAVAFYKQHLVVANPIKLGADLLSNVALLLSNNVGVKDIYTYGKQGMSQYRDFAALRTRLVKREVEAHFGGAKEKEKFLRLQKHIENHPFYPAYKAGFIQSYSTSLAVKDFDTLTGLQKDVDLMIEYITKDKHGNPNEVYRAIDKVITLGDKYHLNTPALLHDLATLSNGKFKKFSSSLENLSQSLTETKSKNDVAQVINNFFLTPSSTGVKLGSSVMVGTDTISKYILGESLRRKHDYVKGRKPTQEEAYSLANELFIDYRKNSPSEIKALSDYDILLFPNFWLRVQKAILHTFHKSPLTASGVWLGEDLLSMETLNIVDANIISKVVNGQVLHYPTDIIDWKVVNPLL